MKSSKELEAEIGCIKQGMDALRQEIKKLDEHKRRVEKGVFFFDDDINGKFQTQEDKIKALEGQQEFNTNRLRKHADRLSSLETKPQDSRREVIKRARAIVDNTWSQSLTDHEANIIYKVISIAEQSLEGGE